MIYPERQSSSHVSPPAAFVTSSPPVLVYPFIVTVGVPDAKVTKPWQSVVAATVRDKLVTAVNLYSLLFSAVTVTAPVAVFSSGFASKFF